MLSTWKSPPPTSQWNLAFPNFDAKLVRKIEMENRDGILKLEKKEDGWYITSPYEKFANQRRIEQVLTIIEQVDCTQGLSQEKEKYGLSQPRLRIRTDGSKKNQLILGDDTPTNTGDYIICQGTAGRSKTKISDRISSTFTDYHSKNIVNISIPDVDSITFPNGETISKIGAYWYQVLPSKVEIDQDAFNEWLTTTLNIQISKKNPSYRDGNKEIKIGTSNEEQTISWSSIGLVRSPLHNSAAITGRDREHLEIAPNWLYAKSFVPPSKMGNPIQKIEYRIGNSKDWITLNYTEGSPHPFWKKMNDVIAVRKYHPITAAQDRFIITFADDTTLQYDLITTTEGIFCLSPLEDVLIRVPSDFFAALL